MTTPPPTTPRAKQRGAAAIMLALIVLLGMITLFTYRMDRKQPELDADKRTAVALAQAKEAIIGRSSINGIPTNTQQNPGALPCPDRNDDGLTDNTPTQCVGGGVLPTVLPANTGRVAWKTLTIDDLRDGAGERLWYILSPEFVDQGSSINTTISPPSLPTIPLRILENGVTHSVAGVVISPGRPLAGQNRTASNDFTNYIEGYDPTTNTLTASPISATYNDRILTITAKEIFTVVTFRMARDLAATVPLPYTPGTIGGIPPNHKSTVWNQNNWDAAIYQDGTTSYISASGITLRFQNCNITYTITGPGAVTRSSSSC